MLKGLLIKLEEPITEPELPCIGVRKDDGLTVLLSGKSKNKIEGNVLVVGSNASWGVGEYYSVVGDEAEDFTFHRNAVITVEIK